MTRREPGVPSSRSSPLEFAPDPDVLVNNAGGGPVLRPCFPEATPERWSAALDLNLQVPMLATQLTDAVMTFVTRDDLAGRVMLLERERPPRLLDPVQA